MLLKAAATVQEVTSDSAGATQVITEYGPAIAYPALTGPVKAGDSVIVNRTAQVLGLGTGGFDFIIAVIKAPEYDESISPGHVMKLRYTPEQVAVQTLEEDPSLADVWEKSLGGFPVVVCQLHSQIAHAAAEVFLSGKRAAYIMTDTGCLVASFSRLLRELKEKQLVCGAITTGQAFGAEYETVTVHSALLAAKHFLKADVAIVAQGPGNVGTGTKYGFGGVDQAGLLDIAAALGGEPIAVARISSGDQRLRHQGVSHHTLTTMKLVRSACTIPFPTGMITAEFDGRHKIVEVSDLDGSFDLLHRSNIQVTTMGRDSAADRIFFEAAAAAGKYAASVGEG